MGSRSESRDDSVDGATGEPLSGTYTAPPTATDPRNVARPGPADVPPSLFERFEDFVLLGRGGMGAVYRARDVRLRRTVAVKLLFEGDAGSRGGFLQEARSQARILHPHVCEVFEAGIADHVPFIVMRHVNGKALHDARAEITLEEKVRIVQQAATAIHEAHRLGIIHRDVKPGNVLVERGEDGAWKPYLADFGIARDVAGIESGTARGVQGTPAYMAPEQATGKGHLDRRTDVYGLGATLYGALTGRAPFSASSVKAVLQMVLEEPPAPPRSVEPSIPLDLEAVVLRCLEKDPDARYESAKALAEDLQRFLDGDPVQARPRSLAVRAWKRARKNKVRVALALAAAFAALTVAGLWLRSLRVAAQREELARDMGGAVREMQLLMRSAHLLPLHDVEHERDFLRARLAEIEARTNAAGEIGAGPGNDALGRGHLALQDAETALVHFRKAEQAGYRAPGFDYTMGLALVEEYRRELEKANRLQNERDKAARLAEIQSLYRDPATSRLRAAIAQGVESPEYALGLVAHYEGRHEEALRHAQEAFTREPGLYEAKKLEGDAEYALGSRTRHDKLAFDYARTMEHFDKAADAYRKAAEIARSDPSVHEAECELWIQAMSTVQRNDLPIRPAFERAKGACERAIAASPRSPSGHLRLAFAHQTYSYWVVTGTPEGEPPERALDEATSRAEAAAAMSPTDPFAEYVVGAVWRSRGQYLRDLSRDPTAAVARSIAAYEAAITLDPSFLWAIQEECEMLGVRGQREAWRGVDPRRSFDLALARCQRALELGPDSLGPHLFLIQLRLADVEGLADAGVSPHDAVLAGLAAVDARQARSPSPWNTAYRVELHRREAEYALAAGEDPTPALARAEAEMARLTPAVPDEECAALVAVTSAEAHLARMSSGAEPPRAIPDLEQALSRARTAFAAAIPKWPRDTKYAVGLARVELATLRYHMALGKAEWQDAEAALAPMDKLLSEALDDPRPFELAARIHAARVELCAQLHRDAMPEFTAGIARAEQAVKVAPGLAAGHAALGVLRVLMARATSNPEKKKDLGRLAAEALAEAVKRNPLLGRSHAAWIEEAKRTSERL